MTYIEGVAILQKRVSVFFLPSKLRRELRMERGAEQSDGSLLSEGSVSEFFQHGN